MANKRPLAVVMAQQKDRELTKLAKEFAKKIESVVVLRAYSSYVIFDFRTYFLGRKPATMILPKEIAKICRGCCDESELEERLEPLQMAYFAVVDFFNNIEGTMFSKSIPYFSAEQEIILTQVEQLLKNKSFQVKINRTKLEVKWWDINGAEEAEEQV